MNLGQTDTAVSYTHLDVYKRQTPDKPEDNKPGGPDIDNPVEKPSDGSEATIAVSYTHLDVYKRQWQYSWW